LHYRPAQEKKVRKAISHKKTLYIAVKQTKMSFFFLLQNWRRAEQIPPWGGAGGRGELVQWEGKGVGERVWEGAYSANIVCTCKRKNDRPADIIPGMEEEWDKEE
jgi:hypothetical protein